MALNFPTSPTNGQVFDNYYYDSSISSWRSNGSKNGLSTRMATEESRSTALELADATTNKSGLVPIIPTSVDKSGGTATVSASGAVTFATTSFLRLNGVFTSKYTNYRVVWSSATISAASNIQFGLCSLGVDVGSNNYWTGGMSGTSASTVSGVTWRGATAGYLGYSSGSAATLTSVALELFNPTPATLKVINTHMGSWVGSDMNAFVFSTLLNSPVISDGIKFFSSSGTVGGTISVFGYNS
jgi:hypothetical protein